MSYLRLKITIKINRAILISFGMLALFCGVNKLSAQQLAFPTADGYGKYVTGGRGGSVIEVTNLNDDNQPGSLRYAINQSGPRTILFRISGTIALNSTLTISKGDLSIAGQTAPGDGICIMGNKLDIRTSNVIIRYIRCRVGVWAADDDGVDGLGGFSSKNSAGSGTLPIKNIIIDHCSVSYATDEGLSIYDIETLTVQWCIVSESLNKKGHGYGGIWGGWGASFHHNLFAHHKSRCPRFCGARYQFNLERELCDMRYNVLYNSGKTYGGEGGNYNVINNYYKRCSRDFVNAYTPNPSSSQFVGIPFDSIKSYWYVEGNYIYGDSTTTADNWNDGVELDYPPLNIRLYEPLPSEYIGPEETAEEAFLRVCNEVGASKPKRDSVDIRVINDVINGTGKVPLAIASIPGEAFPVLNSLPAPHDDDHDGMPNDWERTHNLNPEDPEDRNNIGQDGYTMLEVYLNSLTGETTTHVDYIAGFSSDNFELHQNYPNPFNSETTIRFAVPHKSGINLKIYNMMGQEIVTLVNTEYQPGTFNIRWNGNDSFGNTAPSGIYIYRLEAEGIVNSNKMVLLK